MSKITLEMFEEMWGKPSLSNGLDFFEKSHESVANNKKATDEDLCITSLEELLK
jgi:hypothetical protein